jgi:hypothetical protein
MKAQLQQAIANAPAPIVTPAPTTGTTPPVPPVATPAATLAQRIAAATTLAALLQLEAEARTSSEHGIWLVYLDAVSTLHAAAMAVKIKAAADKAAADAAAAQAAADAILQSSILKIVEKFAPMLAAAPTLLAQIAPVLDSYRAARGSNQTVASIINQMANTPMPVPATCVTADAIDPDGFNW